MPNLPRGEEPEHLVERRKLAFQAIHQIGQANRRPDMPVTLGFLNVEKPVHVLQGDQFLRAQVSLVD